MDGRPLKVFGWGGPGLGLCGGRRRSTDLDWVMDAACSRHWGGDSGHRHHFLARIRVVVASLCSRGLVASPVGAVYLEMSPLIVSVP
jgi:hypothetical protein